LNTYGLAAGVYMLSYTNGDERENPSEAGQVVKVVKVD
jgi:hypothetical protein